MRIRTFCKFLEMRELEPLKLENSTLVIDGQNFMYNSYKESKLPHRLGCESHHYASYLREYLAMFKKANIKCYFIFKGGHQNMEKRLRKVSDDLVVTPVFTRSIYKEVLDEMGFEYVTCEYENKKDVIELAQTLNCPVVSYDIEYCFSGLQYIPRNELKFNEADNTIDCRYFLLDKFLKKYKLTAEKIALFIVLTDVNIFPENFFLDFFKRIRAPQAPFQRNSTLLVWLSKNNQETTIRMVSRFANACKKNKGLEMKKFVEEVDKAQLMIGRREKGGLGAACMLNPAAATVLPEDPNWFAKGVAGKQIANNYVNLYRSKYFFGSVAADLVDPMILSLEIVKYAYDLLTNFQNDGFTFMYETHAGRESLVVSEMYSIRKPEYDGRVCVFENGWDAVRELGLLQHFLRETLQLQELAPLARLPEDARLLVLALLYFSRRKPTDTSAEAAYILLSYTTLSVVLEKCDQNNLPILPIDSEPIIDPTTDVNTVTDGNCNVAAAIMAEYLSLPDDAAEKDIDQKLLFPLEEFQRCLRQLNDLNALCGAPFRPTVFSRTYSGSLVYWLRRAAGAGRWRQFLDGLLAPAPTVYAFLNGLIEVYEAL